MASNVISCPDCLKKFPTQLALEQHRRDAHPSQQPSTPGNEKPFKCKFCTKSYTSQASLDQHIGASHATDGSPKPADDFPCDECKRKYTSAAGLTQHKQESHIKNEPSTPGNEKPFKCKFCAKSYASQASLDQHIGASHPTNGCSKPVDDFPCDECKRKFPSAAALAQHKQESHIKNEPSTPGNEKPFKCMFCTKSYASQASLDQHIEASHPAEGCPKPVDDFPCDECKRKFPSAAALTQHKQESHIKNEPSPPGNEKPFKCKFCAKFYASQASLDQHIGASHPTEGCTAKPADDFPCDECKRKYTSAAGLTQHKQESHIKNEPSTPGNEKPFKCKLCTKSYASQASLDQHIEASHPADGCRKPADDFPCDECKRKFPSAAALAQHKQESHIKVTNLMAKMSLTNRQDSTADLFVCGQCRATFKDEVSLNQHLKSTGHKAGVQNQRKAYIEHKLKDTKLTITKEDRKKSIKHVKSVIDKLIKSVRTQDGGKIYLPDIHKAGSSAVGAKIGMADEFDTNIPVQLDVTDVITKGDITYMYKDKLTTVGIGPKPQNLNVDRELEENINPISIPHGQAIVKVNPNKTPSSLTLGDNLIPHKMLQDFYKKLAVALEQTALKNQGVSLSKIAHGPALTLTLKQEQGRHDISVDLTLSLVTPNIPVDAHGWPRPETYKAYSKEKIEEVKSAGVHLVPKGDETWSISYSKAEKALLQNIDAGNGCRKAVLKFLKRHFQICKSRSGDGLPGISSHIIKTQILWSSEQKPGDEHWHESNIDKRVIDTMRELERGLEAGKLPYYFCPTIEVLANKDRQVLMTLANYLAEERQKLEALPTQSSL